MNSMEIKTLFIMSRRVAPNLDSIKFGKYTIEPIPSSETENSSATNQYLLRFQDVMDENELRSSPTKEAEQTLALLSLWFGTSLQIKSFMVNSVNTGDLKQRSAASGLIGIIENPPNLQLLIDKFNSLNIDLARQFLRAANVYNTAVNIIGQNNTLAFFLLTVSVECLSNKTKTREDKGSCDSFINFILKYLSDKSQLNSELEWKEILKEIYYNHRSGFTHGGKEIPEATNLADNLNRVYVTNFIDGKEIKTPSLKWFETIVRNTLTGFLLSQENSDNNEDRVKEISLEHGIVRLKARNSIQKGSIVTEKDILFD